MRRIVVHGGAGKISDKYAPEIISGVEKAAIAGFSVLDNGGSAVGAVEAAVRVMEEIPIFNAGRGSALNLNGEIEMDAAIMDGATLNCGAVALVKRYLHPISLARIIMEKSDHVFIAGDFIEEIANRYNILPTEDLISERAKEKWMKIKEKFKLNQIDYLARNYDFLKELRYPFDTVGAVAIDDNNNLAAATSTGGITLKLPGRIGDTPLIGCGTYADNEGAAISATGIGEQIIKLAVASKVSTYIQQGMTPKKAISTIFELAKRRLANPQFGLIVIDSKGNIGLGHLTNNMSWAYIDEKTKKVKSGLEVPNKIF
ncbi:MAG: isoaspartyl peptidase/L-asparaginase family protein [Candidatus Asgardarchaeia archaeon]